MSDQPTVKLFYSYSHKDEDLRDQLDTHLKLLQRQKVIDVWHDRKIGAGTEWKDAIDDNLEAADIILLLISADFLASDYCFDVEIKRAMEKHHNKSAVVIPVSLRPCDVVDVDFMKLQGLPKDFKHVIKWEHQDEAFTDIAKGIREVANRIRNNNKNHVLSSQNATDTGKLAMSPTNTKTILIAAANPSNETRLRLDIETRDIDEGLRLSKYRERFVLKQQWATRQRDLRRAMQEHEPEIVHFCGHGSGEQGIVLESEDGKSHLIRTEALANFFKLFTGKVECVVLNACYSEVQAEEIAKYIPYVIGMSEGIGDKAAIEFAVGFYDSLAAGNAYEKAYEFGCNAIEMAGIIGHLIPRLFTSPK